MLSLNQIKPSYSADVDAFLKNGGEIKPAVNSNKIPEFNGFNADMAAINAAKPSSSKNTELREQAKKQGLKKYVPVAPCKKCNTSERSVSTNLCLCCDRRRARAKTKLSTKNLKEVGHYLLTTGDSIEFTSNGKKYVLKIEEV